MFSQDDESTGVALGVVFALIFLVISLVIGLAIFQKNKSAKMTKAAVVAAAPAVVAPVAAAAMPTAASADGASVKVEGGVVKFYFAPGKAELAQDGAKALAEILLAAKTGKKVGISGFVDPSGDPAKNAELAKQRAFAVRDLLTVSGVPAEQIVLVRPNDIKAGSSSAAEGRRVEVFMI
ncbi:MAG: OmpA family protein [Burkholderiales bacterium]|nr:MAG: OmpA family protein [Burkholderiales bacterium]